MEEVKKREKWIKNQINPNLNLNNPTNKKNIKNIRRIHGIEPWTTRTQNEYYTTKLNPLYFILSFLIFHILIKLYTFSQGKFYFIFCFIVYCWSEVDINLWMSDLLGQMYMIGRLIGFGFILVGYILININKNNAYQMKWFVNYCWHYRN